MLGKAFCFQSFGLFVRRAGGCGVCEESFDCRLSAEARICSVFIAEKKNTLISVLV